MQAPLNPSILARGPERTPGASCDGGRRGSALVVDDEPVNLRLLKRMLELDGFAVRTASSGEEALASFESQRPDIVFMDVMMPRMSGVETARRIKSLAADDFVPVIFLTALDDADTMMDCIQAGGDDFLTKPVNITLLRARIRATERVRDLQRSIAASSAPLAELVERERQEQLLAERVFSRAIYNRNVENTRLRVLQRSAAMFSGDLFLAQYLPDGGIRMLMADITGHGLGATIGALPVAEAFHAMTLKGVADGVVLDEINRKLHGLLPADRFMSAFLVTLSASGDRMSWWNGGMPSAWLRARDGVRELVSHALPLGVLPELPASDAPREIEVAVGDALLLVTDGLVAGRDAEGRRFGEDRLRAHLDAWQHGDPVFHELTQDFLGHCGTTPQPDDVAVIELAVDRNILELPEPVVSRAPTGHWCWSADLRDEHLGKMRTLVSVLEPLGLTHGLEPQADALERIVSELYRSALARGIHCNVSTCEVIARRAADGPDAIGALCRARGCHGRIRLDLSYDPRSDGGRLRAKVVDGAQPCLDSAERRGEARTGEIGPQGFETLEGLCEALVYSHDGFPVEAVFAW